jgi:hypothetical protein
MTDSLIASLHNFFYIFDASNNGTASGDSAYELMLLVNDTDPDATVSQLMDDVAVAMTNNIRNAGEDFANGSMLKLQVFIEVTWYWIILPAIVVLASTVFVLATVAQNGVRQCPVWKSSVLAVVYHGLLDTGDEPMLRLTEMEEDAGQRKVHLEAGSQDRLRLLQQRSPSAS